MALWPLRSRSSSSVADTASEPSTPTAQSKRRSQTMPAAGGPGASSSTRVGQLARPPSPTRSTRSAMTSASTATRASKMDFGQAHRGPDTIITKSDLLGSLETYERLLVTAKAYRNAMLALASATSNFASALEDCARQKGAAHAPTQSRNAAAGPSHATAYRTNGGGEAEENDEDDGDALQGQQADLTLNENQYASSAAGERLMAAAGLHHVMSNQQQLLSDTFYKSFEIPLLENFDNYKSEVQDRSMMYEKETEDKSKKIRDTEAENMRHGRKKQRDLAAFRRALQTLQSQVDDLDRVKADYYHEVLAGERETWDLVSTKVALVVRSQIDSADRIVTKASSDSMIESMVQTILDPFNVYGPPKGQEEGQIFSVLAPLSIASPASSGSPNHPVHALARSRTNLSTSTVVLSGINNGTDDSPATTARWAEEQKRRSLCSQGEPEETPGRRNKNQLSWIQENEDDAEDKDSKADTDGDNPREEELRKDQHISMPDEAIPHWQ